MWKNRQKDGSRLGKTWKGKSEAFNSGSCIGINSAGNFSFRQKRRHFVFFKLKVLGDVTRKSVDEFVKESIAPTNSVLFTDKNSAYMNLEKMVENHIKVKSSYESTIEDLKWIYATISNLKRNPLGIYHMVSEKHFQSYLIEFSYKLNRRYIGDKRFDRLFIASVYPYVQHSE